MAIRLLAIIASAVSGYLLWITFTHGTVSACGDESSHIACDHVLRSPWSRWLGLPVSLFGCAVYLSILFASFWIIASKSHANVGNRFHGIAERVLFGLVTIVAGSALWFLGLQVFVIGKFCLHCVSIHLCGIAIATLLVAGRLWDRRRHQGADYISVLQHATIGNLASQDSIDESRGPLLLPYVIAMAGLMVLVFGQVFFPAQTFEVTGAAEFVDADTSSVLGSLNSASIGSIETETTQGTNEPFSATDSPSPKSNGDEESESISKSLRPDTLSLAATEAPVSEPAREESREVSLLKGKFTIDVYRHGLLGSPDADNVIVELVDYTCKDCRRLHQYFKQVREQYDDRLAIVVLPVPLETSCNPHVRHTHPAHVGACKYARLALAVLEVDRVAFHEFHDWLMESQHPPTLRDAEHKAIQLVNEEQLQAAINSVPVRERLRAHVRLFRRVGRFPAMIIRDEIVIGVPKTADDLAGVLKQRLGSEGLDF